MIRAFIYVAAGVCIALLAQYVWQRVTVDQCQMEQFHSLTEIVEGLLQREIPGVSVVEVVAEKSTVSVNYVYDDLFDVRTTYLYGSSLYTIGFPVGNSGHHWITPPAHHIQKLHAEAKAEESESQLESNPLK